MLIRSGDNQRSLGLGQLAGLALQAHLALLCKNVPEEALDYRAASTLLVAQVYLSNFYSWDLDISTRGGG